VLGSGNDSVTAGALTQSLFAGEGEDFLKLDYSLPTAGPDGVQAGSVSLRLDTDSTSLTSHYENIYGQTGSLLARVRMHEFERFDITATDGNDEIYTKDGNDRIIALGGDDVINAGAGDDSVDGGADNDLLIDGDGNDTYTGGDGVDTLKFFGDVDEFIFLRKEDGKISIEGATYKDVVDASVEFFQFADQTIDLAAVLARAGDIPVNLTGLYGEFMSVQMSSQHASIYGGDNLLDGDASSFAHTRNGADEWISLDFGDDLEVTSIQLTNRDGSGSRLDGAVVSLLDGTGTVVHTFDPITGAEDGEVLNLVLGGATTARSLYIDGVSDQYLHLAEIDLFGL
jgi:hypothetical protein